MFNLAISYKCDLCHADMIFGKEHELIIQGFDSPTTIVRQLVGRKDIKLDICSRCKKKVEESLGLIYRQRENI